MFHNLRHSYGHHPWSVLCSLVLIAALTGAASLAAPSQAQASGGGGGQSSPPSDDHGGGGGDDGGDDGGHGGGGGDRPDKQTVLPRSQADEVGGDYMQLTVMWLPVKQGNRSRYEAFTVRLVPHPDHRVAACYKAPWAHEALLMELTREPIQVSEKANLDKNKALKQRLLTRIADSVGPDLYTDVIVGSGILAADPEEQRISEMCR